MTPEGDEQQTTVEKPGENSEIQDQPLGEILRRAREDLGLDYAQLSEITRLRPPVLEALENEEWDRLTAPVFVKGFLKTYARALRLSEEDILRRYGERGSDASSVPKPLASLTPPRKKTPAALFIFLILFIGLAFFTWHRYDLFQGTKEPLMTEERSKGEMEQANDKPKAGAVPGFTAVKPEERLPDTAISKTEPAPARKERTAIPDRKTSDDVSRKAIAQPPAIKEPSETRDATESGSKTLTLAAEVRETTWVKVIVDDAPPKEYIFRPGSHPEWKAHKGFEIVIGNAAGIALVFNGRKLDNLGRHGKVISLKLPE